MPFMWYNNFMSIESRQNNLGLITATSLLILILFASARGENPHSVLACPQPGAVPGWVLEEYGPNSYVVASTAGNASLMIAQLAPYAPLARQNDINGANVMYDGPLKESSEKVIVLAPNSPTKLEWDISENGGIKNCQVIPNPS